MKAHVNADRLASALSSLVAITRGKLATEELAGVLLRFEDGALHLTANNREESLALVLRDGVEIKVPGTLLVNAQRLLGVVAGSAKATVLDLVCTDSGGLVIKAGRSRFTLPGMDAKLFLMPQSSGTPLADLHGDNLAAGIALTAYAVSTETSDLNVIQALAFRFAAGRLRLTATNRHRLAEAEVPTVVNAEAPSTHLVPLRAARIMAAQAKGGPLGIEALDGTLLARGRDGLFTTRLIEGAWPNSDGMFERVALNPRTATCAVADLAGALKQVAPLMEDRARPVRLTFKAESLEISTVEQAVGEAVAEIDATYDAVAPLVLGVSPRYLDDYLDAVEAGTLTFKLSDPRAPFHLQVADGPRALISPMALPGQVSGAESRG